MADMSIRSRSETLEKSTNNLGILKRIVKELSEKFLNESCLEVRRVGVKVSNFRKKQNGQKLLTSFLKEI